MLTKNNEFIILHKINEFILFLLHNLFLNYFIFIF